MKDLPIIQKTYDLLKWYVSILNRLLRDHKYMLGDRTSSTATPTAYNTTFFLL
jgi:hypothetical protein